MLMNRHAFTLAVVVSTFLISSCTPSNELPEEEMTQQSMVEALQTYEADSIATFAGGCFWCMEPSFEALEGVTEVISGYAGGTEARANYAEVSSGATGHREAVQVSYDSQVVSYETLLDTYWRQIDPTDPTGQFADRGFQYTTAIFYHDEAQQALALESVESLEEMEKFEDPIATVIDPFTTFFPAEEFHQDFYKKSADYYEQYAEGSGRKGFIEENWAKEAALEFSGR